MTMEAATAAPAAEPAAAAPPAPEAQPAATPPDQSQPVPATATAPETTQPLAPETPEPPSAATPPTKPASFDDLPDDVKTIAAGEIARREESARRTAEAAAATQQATQRRQYVASEQFTRDFDDLARQAAEAVNPDGTIGEIDRAKVNTMFGAVLATGAENVVRELGGVFEQLMGADFEPTADEAALLRAAAVQYQQNPVAGSGELFTQWIRMHDRVALEAATTRIRTEEAARADKAAAKRIEEAEAASTRDTSRGNASAPTGGGNSVPDGGAWTSRAQIDAAHAKKQITTEAYSRLTRDGTYFRLPAK